MLNNRVSAARRLLDRFGLDALVLFGLPAIRYLSGFTGSDGALVLTAGESWFLTDSRYTGQAALETSGVRIREYRGKCEGVADLLGEMKTIRVGIESEHTTVALFRALGGMLPDRELVPLGGELDELRMVKDDEEIRILGRCAELASSAFLAILEKVRPGAVERDIAIALEFAMKTTGADDKSFDFIVASGPRGTLPHGKAGERILETGEFVTIDFGALCQGYHSDETVTLAVGVPDARHKEIYGIVKDAHDLAMSAVQPGVSLKELDLKARDYISAKGYGSYFGHGLGHGVGLEVHEKPVVSFRSEGVVEEGMVFTIEPGIYIPEWGGVRIEDTVVVTRDGCRPLTRVPKELMIL
jgi:Xaa-Pro aminopeptidase